MAKSAKEQVQQARDLIQEGRYKEAHRLLKTIDHPIADDWLKKVEKLLKNPAAAQKALASQPVQTPGRPVVEIDEETRKARANRELMGLLVGIPISIIGGAILGVIAHFISEIFYVMIAFPLIAGGVAGFVAAFAIDVGRIRDKVLAVFLGIIAGFSLFVAFYVTDYVKFRQGFETASYEVMVENGVYGDIETARQNIPASELQAELDTLLAQQYGRSGIIGYAMLLSDEGLTVTNSSRRGSSRTSFSGTMLYAYWFLELALMTGAAAAFCFNISGAPFCEETNKWMKMKTVGVVLDEEFDLFLQAMRYNDYRTASSFIRKKSKKETTSKIEAGRCSPTSEAAFVKVTQQQGRNSKELINTAISGAEYEDLTGVKMII